MGKYLLKRMFRGLTVVAASIVIVFFVVRAIPADPVTLMVSPSMDEAAKQALIHRFGLDKTIGVQFLLYIKELLNGNLGISFISRAPVEQIISARLGWTVLLMGVSLIVTVVLGIILGIIAAVFKGSISDKLISFAITLGISVFTPFVAFALLYVFAFLLKWFPTDGAYTPPRLSGWVYYRDIVRHMVLPGAALVITNIAQITMQMRSSMVNVLEENYIRTARAKGCADVQVIKNHALKNSVIPTVTVIGMKMGMMVGGSILIENVFSWPGIGKLLMDAVTSQDYPLMQGVFLLMSVSIVLMNILSDIALALIDPRIRLEGSE